MTPAKLAYVAAVQGFGVSYDLFALEQTDAHLRLLVDAKLQLDRALGELMSEAYSLALKRRGSL